MGVVPAARSRGGPAPLAAYGDAPDDDPGDAGGGDSGDGDGIPVLPELLKTLPRIAITPGPATMMMAPTTIVSDT